MKLFKPFVMAILVVLLNFAKVSEMVHIKFSNLQCDEFDKLFAGFRHCYLKALGRHNVSMNIHVELYDVPVNNITLNAQLLRKGNGYRPYMYNDTMNFCAFMKNQNRNMFWKIVFGILKPYSNINHSCPYDHDIIVKGLILDYDMLKLIPFPPNDYMIRLKVGAYNVYRAEVRIYMTIYN